MKNLVAEVGIEIRRTAKVTKSKFLERVADTFLTRPKVDFRVVRFLKTNDKKFEDSCREAGIEVTRRQASKWLNKKGLAWKKVGQFK